jgi:phosphoribosylformylglycinamidine cyclo-ligase
MAKSWTYASAGVPHLKGDPAFNRQITRLIRSTHVPGVMGSATGFAALFDFKKAGLRDPLLVSSTDGVGTKLEIARLQKRHDTIGIDLVAMCVNDLITCGARPLFFLDYFAAGRFDAPVTREVLRGIAAGCRDAGCALTGGETAIMPGFYGAHGGNGAGQYDVAGFAVGVVERRAVVTGARIRPGDAILGLASTGCHSNGYSLIRKLFSARELAGAVGRRLLTPTRIYVRPVLGLLKRLPLKGIVNITGGGFYDNLPRVMPHGVRAEVRAGAWPVPKLFELIQNSGNITDFEMHRTFNMGIGMALILAPRAVEAARRFLKRRGIASWDIGRIAASKGRPGVEILKS